MALRWANQAGAGGQNPLLSAWALMRGFPSWLKSRGLRRVRVIIGDKAAGMVGSIADVFPKVKYHPVSWTRSTDISAGTMRREREVAGRHESDAVQKEPRGRIKALQVRKTLPPPFADGIIDLHRVLKECGGGGKTYIPNRIGYGQLLDCRPAQSWRLHAGVFAGLNR